MPSDRRATDKTCCQRVGRSLTLIIPRRRKENNPSDQQSCFLCAVVQTIGPISLVCVISVSYILLKSHKRTTTNTRSYWEITNRQCCRLGLPPTPAHIINSPKKFLRVRTPSKRWRWGCVRLSIAIFCKNYRWRPA